MDSSNNNGIIEKRYKEYCDILSKHQSFVLSEKKKRKSQVLSQALGIDTEKELELGDVLRHRGETFQECLLRYSQRSGMTDAEIYNRAHITKQTFSKIRKKGYTPKKNNVMALAIALRLDIYAAAALLESAGQAFSPSKKVDRIVQYCICYEIYDMFEVEKLIHDNTGTTLAKY